MAGPPSPAPSAEILWKQYELQVGLYKEYLNLLLRFNVFYYAATGAMLSYYFSKPEVPWMKYSLCAMSSSMCAINLACARHPNTGS
jgi:hypothetical protein